MSSPFQKSFSAKSPMSPLNGAYTSGADGRVTISDAPHFAKLQSDLVGAVDKAYAKNSNPCDDPNTVQYTKDSVLKKCPPKPETKTAYNKAISSGVTPKQMDKVFDAGSLIFKNL